MWFFKKKQASSALTYVWLVAVAVLLLKVLFLWLTPMRGLASTTWLLDDAFIEMRVARTIAEGGGFSLDGVHATTGAPFLWMYMTSLNHLLLPTRDAAIRATLMESSLWGMLATVVLFTIALKLTKDRRIAWTAFLFSTFTAAIFFNAMNGMETSFFTLVALLSISTFLGIGKPRNWSSFSWGCVTGLLLGITVMTRGDGLFVIASLLCVKLYEWWMGSATERKEHASSLLGIALIAGLLFGSFMTWQLIQTGSPFPGNQVGRRELSVAFHGFSFEEFNLVQYLRIVAWNVFQLADLFSIAAGGALLAFFAFGTGIAQKNLRLLNIFSILYFGVFLALLVGYQWYFSDLHGLRYINTAVHILFIYIAVLLWQLPLERWRTPTVTILGLALVIMANYKHYQMCSRFRWAPYMSYISQPDPEKNEEFWGTIDWIRDNLPEGTLVGVRDYGRVSLFTGIRVQDIAGNIDPAANTALNDGTLDAYLEKQGVNYLLIPTLEQRADKLYQYLHTHLKLQLVPGAPTAPTQNLYKVIY